MWGKGYEEAGAGGRSGGARAPDKREDADGKHNERPIGFMVIMFKLEFRVSSYQDSQTAGIARSTQTFHHIDLLIFFTSCAARFSSAQLCGGQKANHIPQPK